MYKGTRCPTPISIRQWGNVASPPWRSVFGSASAAPSRRHCPGAGPPPWALSVLSTLCTRLRTVGCLSKRGAYLLQRTRLSTFTSLPLWSLPFPPPSSHLNPPRPSIAMNFGSFTFEYPVERSSLGPTLPSRYVLPLYCLVDHLPSLPCGTGPTVPGRVPPKAPRGRLWIMTT